MRPDRRAAVKLQVLRRVSLPPAAPLGERVREAFAYLLRPLPALSRAGTLALIAIALVAGTSAASADSLPDDPLYALKLNSEQMRLGLAQNAQDRAAVQLVIAETRLREANALAAQDRDAEADAAASAYGEYLANAVATLESSPTSSDLVEQLRARVAQQQFELKTRADATPNVVTLLEAVTREIATPGADGGSIADAAARAAEEAATMARKSVDAQVTAPARSAQSAASARPTARPTARSLSPQQQAKLQAAAKAAQEAAERARAAAERAKKAAQRPAHGRP
jgi:hypothetical protein